MKIYFDCQLSLNYIDITTAKNLAVKAIRAIRKDGYQITTKASDIIIIKNQECCTINFEISKTFRKLKPSLNLPLNSKLSDIKINKNCFTFRRDTHYSTLMLYGIPKNYKTILPDFNNYLKTFNKINADLSIYAQNIIY